MKFRRGSPRLLGLGGLLLAAMLLAAAPARTQSYSMLYSFQCGPNDGNYPLSTLTRDTAGSLYGTTDTGGTYGYGTVFRLAADGTETVLHSFAGSPADGAGPVNAGLVLDAAGNLFGTTSGGGSYSSGILFKVASDGTETVLYNFTGQNGDGGEPFAGLTHDTSGNFYGSTIAGGVAGYGTIFKISRSGHESVLYSFLNAPDGSNPHGTLVLDGAGNLYGTAQEGGNRGGLMGAGTVFSLGPTGGETVLHTFTGAQGDGGHPYSGVVRDGVGNLYGTTAGGGASHRGTVFKVGRTGKEAVLHRFTGAPDGATPFASLVRDSAGNLYGVTYYGGMGDCNNGQGVGCGVIFKVTPSGQETVLYSFNGTPDGSAPYGGLTLDNSGNLYGTTSGGGAYGCGTVFKFTP